MSLYNRVVVTVGIILVVLASATIIPLSGQDNRVVTILLPQWIADSINDDLLAEWEDRYTDVEVVVESAGNMFFSSPSADLDNYFDTVENFVQSADILYVQGSSIAPQATQAGYFLDLSAFIADNTEFNEADFYPAMLDAFQWDGGVWAVPIAGDVSMFVYDRVAFDTAGVDYPTPDWTLTDLTDGAIALTQYDENGDPEMMRVPFFDLPTIYNAFSPDAPLYDPTESPEPPNLNRPELVQFLEQYLAVQEQTMPESGGFDFENMVLDIGSLFRLRGASESDDAEQDWQAALLPGNRVGLRVTGLAISADTQYPELTFDLVNFLSSDPAFVQLILNDYPARQSLFNVEAVDDRFLLDALPAEVQVLIEQGLQNAFSNSANRYFDFVFEALVIINEDDVSVEQALDVAQQNALDTFFAAQEQGNTRNE